MASYQDTKGNPWTTRWWQIILRAVYHSTHHHGQVPGFPRAVEHMSPPLDLIAYYRQLG